MRQKPRHLNKTIAAPKCSFILEYTLDPSAVACRVVSRLVFGRAREDADAGGGLVTRQRCARDSRGIVSLNPTESL